MRRDLALALRAGGGFGLGLAFFLIVTVLVALAGYTQLPKADIWQDALLLDYFQPVAVWLIELLPAEYTKNFMF